MNVTVREPFSVSHDGVSYRPGEVVDVPVEVGAEWVRSGWVVDNTLTVDPAAAASGVKA